jgi:hypothetical protein
MSGFALSGKKNSTSACHAMQRWVQPLQLHAGVGCGELPIGFDVFLVAAVLPGGRLTL